MVDPRTEEQIFSDIVDLCTRPGYSHVIAQLSFRNTVVKRGDTITSEDLAERQSVDHLLRNEINALIGCMVKAELDWTKPGSDQIQEMMETSIRLLHEHHVRLMCNAWGEPRAENVSNGFGSMPTGNALREAILYAPESSYDFQFREMAAERYSNDAEWIRKNYGYDPNDAKAICKAISDSHTEVLISALREQMTKPPEEWSVLSGYRLNINEITSRSSVGEAQVESFLAAFTWDTAHRNEEYKQIDDFNPVSTKPIILGPNGERYLFQYYPLVEATYDSPFYWFRQDKKYFFPTATKNRGKFTEIFLETRLRRIFGKQSVFPNVIVYKGKHQLGEIDCLVVFGEYVLLFQAKSQRLTLSARKGNLEQLEEDFQYAVQKAYEQAVTCAKAMNKKGVKFVRPGGAVLDLPTEVRVYPICVLADHYPALTIQTRAFLKSKKDSKLAAPLVYDLFLIDVLAEMLPSPLHFLSYIIWRERFDERVLATNEFPTFGFYLQNNRRVDSKFNLALIEPSMAGELDVAMAARRGGVPGESIPRGTLTKLNDTRLGKIISEIEHDPNRFSVEIGLAILEMPEEAISRISIAIDNMIQDSGRTGYHRDLTMAMKPIDAGLTIHVNGHPANEAEDILCKHMLCKKHSQRAGNWFGLLIAPNTGQLRFGAKVNGPH